MLACCSHDGFPIACTTIQEDVTERVIEEYLHHFFVALDDTEAVAVKVLRDQLC